MDACTQMDNDETIAGTRVSIVEVVHKIEHAIKERQGFSLLRIGDGEGAIINYQEPVVTSYLSMFLNIWFAAEQLPDHDLNFMRQALITATQNADIVGIPRLKQALSNQGHLTAREFISPQNGFEHQYIGDAALHFYLQWSGAIGRILSQVDRVTIIGCRDVTAALEANFDVRVNWIAIRGETAFPGDISEPHWPTGFERVCAQLAEIPRGSLVLIGAGILGKLYCEIVKQNGSIAIDLGSVFDGWASILSRPGRIDLAPQFSLEYAARAATDDQSLQLNLAKIIAETNITDGQF